MLYARCMGIPMHAWEFPCNVPTLAWIFRAPALSRCPIKGGNQTFQTQSQDPAYLCSSWALGEFVVRSSPIGWVRKARLAIAATVGQLLTPPAWNLCFHKYGQEKMRMNYCIQTSGICCSPVEMKAHHGLVWRWNCFDNLHNQTNSKKVLESPRVTHP